VEWVADRTGNHGFASPGLPNPRGASHTNAGKSVYVTAPHTVGGVVEPARALMVIVPAASGIEVEAKLLNRDAGFVHVGQPVSVKFEAFPFTRYGTIPGVIGGLSRDAVPDAKLGSVYIARVTLNRNFIVVDGRRVPLNAGYVATADIRTGSRRIISFLRSPLQSTVAQAGRER
jgi:hemolysin D